MRDCKETQVSQIDRPLRSATNLFDAAVEGPQRLLRIALSSHGYPSEL